MGRPIQAIEDRAIRAALRELQQKVAELEVKSEQRAVFVISNPDDQIAYVPSLQFPLASNTPFTLLWEDRTATSLNPRLLASRPNKTTGKQEWITITGNK